MNEYLIQVYSNKGSFLYDSDEEEQIDTFRIYADKVVEKNAVLSLYLQDELVANFPQTCIRSFLKVEKPLLTTKEVLFDDLIFNWNSIVGQGTSVVSKVFSYFTEGKNSPINDMVLTILLTISRETKLLKEYNPICPFCLVHFENVTRYKTEFYTCPKCFQSKESLKGIDTIYLTINRNMETHRIVDGHDLYINWLFYKERFDFDAILIGQHEDIDIEKLVVNVQHLKTNKIPCHIKSPISDNSRKILERYFDVK